MALLGLGGKCSEMGKGKGARGAFGVRQHQTGSIECVGSKDLQGGEIGSDEADPVGGAAPSL